MQIVVQVSQELHGALQQEKRGIKSFESKWILLQHGFAAVFTDISIGIVENDPFVISEDRMVDCSLLMSVSDHFTAADRAF